VLTVVFRVPTFFILSNVAQTESDDFGSRDGGGGRSRLIGGRPALAVTYTAVDLNPSGFYYSYE